MAIRHKRKNSTGYIWQSDDLVDGQIGLNTADGTLHFKQADNSTVTIAAGAGGIGNVVEDTTPQLGGALDVNGKTINSVSNGNIELAPNGTGKIYLTVDNVRIGNAESNAVLTTNGLGSLTLSTNNGTNSGTILINQNVNGNISIAPNGTGKTRINNINYYELPFTLTYGSTITPNVINGNVQVVTLTGNVTFNGFTSAVTGQSLTLIVKQDATGSRTLTSTMKFAGGEKTLSTAANSVDIISVFYDGTNYWASLSKGFA